ncbi:PASTA domain-containing protein [Kribbella speibonae]|uniref:PASTA domain-containing protein n=1 Tax=Kribbella speibonae TaxID=1572660 RepID=A0A4R0JB30_9ACTN|nr:PASTA domain-containing protein [Kribbella speibonae]TCC41608.1 PASTA domain-containing protein [Kribbella speibonae]
MTDLTDLLARTADQTPVGPPPLDALHAGATRRRRRRAAGLTATAVVAVAAVIAGTTLLTSHDQTAPVTSPTPTPTPIAPATRLVGLDHAAIAVPVDWPTNKSRCGTPMVDTVLIDDPSAGQYCMMYRPVGVESVKLGRGGPEPKLWTDENIVIGGVPAVRRQTTCSTGSNKVRICTGEVRFHDFWFRAESSTSAAEVDRLLSQVVVTPDLAGVPSYQSFPQILTGTEYAGVLKDLGLKATFRYTKNPNYRPGQVLGVSPAPGMMLGLGTTVTVTVVK